MHTSDGLGSNPGPESSLEPGFFWMAWAQYFENGQGSCLTF